AEDDLAVLRVDVDLALGHVRDAEDLRLDLAREGHVVRLGLRLLAEVRAALLQRLGLRGRALDHPLAVAAAEAGKPACRHLTPAPAVVRIEEVAEGGSECDEAKPSRPRHLSRPSRSRATGSRALRRSGPQLPRSATCRASGPRRRRPARRRPSSPRAAPAPRS